LIRGLQVDVADAGLTEWEFSATVTLGRLEEVQHTPDFLSLF